MSKMMYKKSTFYQFSILLLLISTASAANELSITNLAISPQQITPGSNVTLIFQLYDSYGTLTNVNLGLTGTYPVLNYSPQYSQLISSMSYGLYGGINNYFTYNIKLPKNIAAGTYTLNVFATYQISTTSGGVTTISSTSSTMPITFYVSGSPQILVSATPLTAISPGAQFQTSITALNIGTDIAKNVTIVLNSTKNFSVVGQSVAYLGQIDTQKSGSAVFTLQASDNLKPGQSSIPVKLTYSSIYGGSAQSTVSVPVSIVINKPNLVASIISSNPQILYSGSNQTLTILVQNIGTGTAKNVSIDFFSNQNITVGSAASNVFIGTLSAGAATTQSVFITSSKNATLSSYKLPVQLMYQNANYQNSTIKQMYLPIQLQSASIFTVTGISDNLTSGSTYLPITITVKNTGSQTAQHITFTLQTIFPTSPANSNFYLDQLLAGQSANVIFYVNVDSQGNPGSYPLTLYEQWNQPNGANNQQYTGSNNYYLSISPSQKPSSSQYYILIGAAVAIVVIAVVAYSKLKEKKRGK